MEGQAPAQPVTIEDRFASYLNPPTEAPAEPAKSEPEAPEAPAEAEETQAEPEAQEAPPEVEIDPDVPAFEVKVKTEGGTDEVKKVSLSDLQKGFMMQADYQRKTAELARQKESVTTEVEAKVKPVTEKYEHNLKIFAQYAANLAGQELGNVDWQKLSREDPAEFVRLSARQNEINQLYNYSVQQVQKIEQERLGQLETAKAKAAQQAVEVLSDPSSGIPGWNNTLYENVLKTGTDVYGFKFDEVGQVTDPRMIKVLHDAHKYQELQKAKPLVDRKVAAVPKVVKPGNAQRSDETKSQEKELMKQFKNSGGKDVDALAALFQKRISRR